MDKPASQEVDEERPARETQANGRPHRERGGRSERKERSERPRRTGETRPAATARPAAPAAARPASTPAPRPARPQRDFEEADTSHLPAFLLRPVTLKADRA